MNSLRLETVVKELIRLSAHYPETGHRPETLKIISNDYYEVFSYLTNENFIDLARWARLNCKYFPKIVDLQRGLNYLPRQSNMPLLDDRPTRITQEEADKNKERFGILVKQTSGKMSMEEALEKMDAENKP